MCAFRSMELRCLAAKLGWCHHRLVLHRARTSEYNRSSLHRGRVSRICICFKSRYVLLSIQTCYSRFFFKSEDTFQTFCCCLRTIMSYGMLLYASLSSLEKNRSKKAKSIDSALITTFGCMGCIQGCRSRAPRF